MTETEFNVSEKEAEIAVDLVKITQKIAADEFQKCREELKAEIIAELKSNGVEIWVKYKANFNRVLQNLTLDTIGTTKERSPYQID